MNAQDVIRNTLDLSDMVVDSYIQDLDDAELLLRPVAGMNSIAWQLGHLIESERQFVELVKPGSCPPLPEGFDEGHGRNATDVDDPSKFYPRSRYQELWKAQREATRSVLETLSESDLDRTDPSFPPYAPSVGALMLMCGNHALVHVGQFVAVRRSLKKPITI